MITSPHFRLPRLVSILLIALLLPLQATDFQDHPIAMGKELLITDPQVVDSKAATYPGAWSFGNLLDQACGKEEASAQVAQWLERWASGKMLVEKKFVDVGQRPGLRESVIRPWQEKDGYREDSGDAWIPQLEHAPFRLLAIVNRMDLLFDDAGQEPEQGPGGYRGGPTIADRQNGEARLIFGLVDAHGLPVEKGLTLIFEYGLDGNDKESRLDWAMAWHALGKHSNFDQAYLDELEKVTRCFTDRCMVAIDPARQPPASVVNHIMARRSKDRNQLLRVRSNDGVGGALREFREFGFDGTGFAPVVLANSPKEEFFDTNSSNNRQLTRWLASDVRSAQAAWQKAVRDNKDPSHVPTLRQVTLPLQIEVRRELVDVSGFASVAKDDTAHWDGWGMGNQTLRRNISLQSCCGCHCGDTNTAFYHVAPRVAGEASVTSTFLRTDGRSWSLKDPGSLKRIRSHEMEDRQKFLESLLDPAMPASEKRKIRDSRMMRVH
jgi:hypothetical protein